MFIALVTYNFEQQQTGGNPPEYRLFLTVNAADGANNVSASFNLTLPAGINRHAFNAAIVQGAIDRIRSGHPEWSVDPRDVFFSPFDNG